MSSTAQAVLEQALRLDPIERVQLIDELYHSLDRAEHGPRDARWAEEIESRIDAYEAGKIQADTADAVFSRINQR